MGIQCTNNNGHVTISRTDDARGKAPSTQMVINNNAIAGKNENNVCFMVWGLASGEKTDQNNDDCIVKHDHELQPQQAKHVNRKRQW